jgi:hypothetical protein
MIDGVNAIDYVAPDKLGLNITIEQFPEIIGLVSFFEEDSARIESGYTIPEWENLDKINQAREVALRRIRQAIDAYASHKKERMQQ